MKRGNAILPNPYAGLLGHKYIVTRIDGTTYVECSTRDKALKCLADLAAGVVWVRVKPNPHTPAQWRRIA